MINIESSIMDNNHSAVSMNNLGASCIATGDLMEAVAHLVNALRYSKDLLQATTAAHEEDFQSSDARFDAWISQEACTHGNSAAAVAVTGSFVYSQPIVIPTDDTTPRSSGKFETNLLITSAIVFNMAIAHHLSGIQQGNDPRLLQIALMFYERSFDLSEVYRNDHTGSCMYYTMAVLNNVGVCYRSMGQGEFADKAFSTLLTYLLYAHASPQQSITSNLETFFVNVSYLAFPSSMSTAPAA
jgi:hypothetical protein